MTKLILLNGPPRSGKDFAGAILQDMLDPAIAHCVKFAQVVKEGSHAAYRLSDEDGLPLVHNAFEAVKDKPNAAFYEKTPRAVYIAYSEAFMKPLHGKDIFGRILLNRLLMAGDDPDVVIVTDSGFTEEAGVLIAHYGLGNSFLVRIHREGTSFEGDSRSYLSLECEAHDLTNPGTPEGLRAALEPVVDWTA